MPIPKRPARISIHGLSGWNAKARNPATIIVTIPKTRWWTWTPPVSMLPGHQLTCARIILVLKRMNANDSSRQPSRISPARCPRESSDESVLSSNTASARGRSITAPP